ncbi:MAG: ROK family transcriptional regulator [Rhodobacteraceae bacterium]|nr:ROK family transcriptional regulator [Paracoccaceae bacterium]
MAEQDTQIPLGGATPSRIRNHNERLLLSIIARQGAVPGSDIARASGLSPQTVSVILRKLEQDGLLLRNEPQRRGGVGKPSVPMALDADGLLSIGLKIGRRTADLLLIDFLGNVRQELHISYRYPMPDQVFAFLERGLAVFRSGRSAALLDRTAGIGVAMPFQLWSWFAALGAPEDDMQKWREIDFAERVSRFSDLPVFIQNDATAACRAEHVYGRGKEFSEYAYFFIGSFIGGGVVMNGSVVDGRHGNAGAFGSIPVATDDGVRQLIDAASLHLLEARLEAAGINPGEIWDHPHNWDRFGAQLSPWLDDVSLHLAEAALTVCSVIDFDTILIDGAFPTDVRTRLVALTAERLSDLDMRGLVRPEIVAGEVGSNARALGAAIAPIDRQYFLDGNAGFAAG